MLGAGGRFADPTTQMRVDRSAKTTGPFNARATRLCESARADQVTSAAELSGYLVGSPAFKARTAHFRDLGISANAQATTGGACRSMTPGDERFAIVRGLFADLGTSVSLSGVRG